MHKNDQNRPAAQAPSAVKDLKPSRDASVKGGHIAVSDSGVANPKPIVVPIKK